MLEREECPRLQGYRPTPALEGQTYRATVLITTIHVEQALRLSSHFTWRLSKDLHEFLSEASRQHFQV